MRAALSMADGSGLIAYSFPMVIAGRGSSHRIQSGTVFIDTLMILTATIVARDFTEYVIVVRVVTRLASILGPSVHSGVLELL